MAFYTYRNDIQPVFLCIAFMVMILFCLCRAVMTLKDIRSRQSTGSDSIIHHVFSFKIFGMMRIISICSNNPNFSAFFALSIMFSYGFAFLALDIALLIAFISSFPLFALSIAFFGFLTFFALLVFFVICQLASFAFISVFAKFRDWFNLRRIAMVTDFGYDLLSHNRLLLRRLRLEPAAGYAPALGSPYFKQTMIAVKYEFGKYLFERINPCFQIRTERISAR